jgi:hypothetical protein
LKQSYQNVTGALGSSEVKGSLRAEQITFTAGNAQYTAKVNGDTMTGTVKTGSNSTPFTATRTGS